LITVNKRETEWHEGMTVQELLDMKNYTFKMIVVKVNGNVVPKKKYDTYEIHDGDNVDAIHLISGG
jgi:sulfur carrier protein